MEEVKQEVKQEEKQSNGIGTAGFVVAICSVVLCWVPFLNWILNIVGLVLSFIGVFRKPKGLAIAGLVITGIGWIIMIVAAAAIASAFL